MSTITLIAMIVIGIAIIILSYKYVKLLSLNRKLNNDIDIAQINANRLEYLVYKLRTQLEYSTPRCGMCGKMTSNDKKKLMNNIPYCPDCYRYIIGVRHDN